MNVDLILDARADPDELAELGQLAETFGFGGIWVSSLLDSRDPFTNLSVLARSTSEIALGPVAVNPYDMHPVRIATALMTLNEMANGRARIVIGGGGEALASLGLQPERRVRAVRECVEIIHAAGRGERSSYAGEIYQVTGYGLDWVSQPAPAVFVGANMEQMLKMSARTADGIMISDLPVALAATTLASVAAMRQSAGTESGEFWTSMFTAWHVYADAGQARREARQWLLLRGLFRPWVLQEFLDEPDCDLVMSKQDAFLTAFLNKTHEIDGVPDAIIDALVDKLTLTGAVSDIDRLIEELLAFSDAGLSSISLRLYADPAKSIGLLGREVLPALKDSH